MRSHPCGLSVRLPTFKEQFEKQWRRCCWIPRKAVYPVSYSHRRKNLHDHFTWNHMHLLQTNVESRKMALYFQNIVSEVLRFSRLLRETVCSFPTFLAYVNIKQQSFEYTSHPRWYENYLISTQTLCSTYKVSSKMINLFCLCVCV